MGIGKERGLVVTILVVGERIKRAISSTVRIGTLLAQIVCILNGMLQNIGAGEIRFTSSELAERNASVSAIQIRGALLPEQVLVLSGVEAPPKK